MLNIQTKRLQHLIFDKVMFSFAKIVSSNQNMQLTK